MSRDAFGRGRVAAVVAVALALVLGGLGVAHAQRGFAGESAREL